MWTITSYPLKNTAVQDQVLLERLQFRKRIFNYANMK